MPAVCFRGYDKNTRFLSAFISEISINRLFKTDHTIAARAKKLALLFLLLHPGGNG
jgi:hypothetical protein